MRTDQSSMMQVKPAITPAAAITGNGTTTGSTIDTQGYESLTFAALSGVITDGTFAGTIYGGNAANMSDEAALTGNQIIDPNLAFATTDDGVDHRQGVNIAAAGFRYYRLKLVQAGATTGGFVSAVAILQNPRYAPVAAP